jgi:phosphatidylglycerophosphatase A
MRSFIIFTATWAYLGKSPLIPGTVGTLGAVPLVCLFAAAGPLGYVVASVAFCVFSVWSAEGYERIADKHDSREIVIDEVAGFLVTMAFLPLTWQTLLAGFFLFRLLDITKPTPIGILDEKIDGGFGVVVDDLVAGLFANVLLHLAVYFLPGVLGVGQFN